MFSLKTVTWLTSRGLLVSLPVPDDAVRIGRIVNPFFLGRLALDSGTPASSTCSACPLPMRQVRVTLGYSHDLLNGNAGLSPLVDHALVAPVFEGFKSLTSRPPYWTNGRQKGFRTIIGPDIPPSS